MKQNRNLILCACACVAVQTPHAVFWEGGWHLGTAHVLVPVCTWYINEFSLNGKNPTVLEALYLAALQLRVEGHRDSSSWRIEKTRALSCG